MSFVPGEVSFAAHTESYRVGVAGMVATVHLVNGNAFDASFYLRLSRSLYSGWEGLGERLNDPTTRFLACKVEHQLQLLHLQCVAYVEMSGLTFEAEHREQLGAMRQPAHIVLRSGETLSGDFLSILPPNRSRISDLLNEPGERFLLFLSRDATCWVNRDAIERVRA